MLVDTNMIGIVSHRMSEGVGQESSTDPKGSEAEKIQNQNPEKNDRTIMAGLEEIDQNVRRNLTMRKDESKNESVRKWKRMARKIQVLQTRGNGDQKEKMRVLENKRGVQQLKEEEVQTEQEGICKKMKRS